MTLEAHWTSNGEPVNVVKTLGVDAETVAELEDVFFAAYRQAKIDYPPG